MTFLVRLGAVTVLVLGAAACSADEPAAEPDGAPPVVQLGAPGEAGTTLAPDEVEGLEDPIHTAADVTFVQQMIPHHEQALAMTALVAGRASSDDLATIAERIEASQGQEIDQMEDWLTTRGEGVAGMHGDHSGDHSGMPGMLSPRQLDRLEAASGKRFDRLFLQAMIRHHEGAVVMVESLLAGGEGGQESEVFQLASHIATDQAVEIAAMKRELRQAGRE
ncbi:DUF305 domain-containing protein [Mycobacterium cookii]|uniref:DUF305 domain-containing protein n=1 Tax=Nocardioides furvisabuli TaxID=375542 RepID=A0ABP5ID14_9ACTN|nr:DUF305 domain-containing protein [Nocardioides furvisabuli]